MKILAFSGKKQSGKDTIVNYLMQNYSCVRRNFADFLKTIVENCFDSGYTDGTDEEKNIVLSCGMSTRNLLQYLGTDVMRDISPNCWVRAYKHALLPYDGLVLTSDVRFPNEVTCVQELGGHVIRLTRNPFDDKHESETNLNIMEKMFYRKDIYEGPMFDEVVDNSDMSVEEQNEAVWKLVNEKGWI